MEHTSLLGDFGSKRIKDQALLIARILLAMLFLKFGWAKLKPSFAAIYADTFTQEEVDGLIAFYDGPIGQSLIAKTPELTLRSLQMMQQRMGPVLQRVEQIAREEAENARATGAPTR